MTPLTVISGYGFSRFRNVIVGLKLTCTTLPRIMFVPIEAGLAFALGLSATVLSVLAGTVFVSVACASPGRLRRTTEASTAQSHLTAGKAQWFRRLEWRMSSQSVTLGGLQRNPHFQV